MKTNDLSDFINKIADGESAEELIRSFDGKEKSEAENLIPAIQKLAKLSLVSPSAELREKIKHRMLDKAAAKQAGNVRSMLSFPNIGFRLRPALVLAALMILCTGTAFASTGAMPDSLLYPVKKAIESVSKSVNGSRGKALLVLTFNERRIQELKFLQESGRHKEVSLMVKEINNNIKELKNLSKELTYQEKKNLDKKLAHFINKNEKLLNKQEAGAVKKRPPGKTHNTDKSGISGTSGKSDKPGKGIVESNTGSADQKKERDKPVVTPREKPDKVNKAKGRGTGNKVNSVSTKNAPVKKTQPKNAPAKTAPVKKNK